MSLAELRPVQVEGVPNVDWGPDPDSPARLYERYPDSVAGAAVSALRYLREAEPQMTADLCWALPADARAHGLQSRVKSPASLARKIEARILMGEYESSSYTIADQLTDLVRYTGVAATPEQVVPMARTTLRRLRRRGWALLEAEHSYLPGNPYKGLHVLIRDPHTGLSVEVQFHSEASQRVKDRHHLEYETARDLTQTPSARHRADAVMRKAWAQVPHPPGIEQLTVLAGVPLTPKAYPRRPHRPGKPANP